MIKVYAVIGSPGSGKSWVCEQLKDKFNYVPNDQHIGQDYVAAIVKAASTGGKRDLLIDVPFSVSPLKEPLERRGLTIEPVYLVEDEKTLAERYAKRGRGEIPQGHISRQRTHHARALETGSFYGNSDQVLKYLKGRV